MAYVTWKCPDLDNAVLYMAEALDNPDSDAPFQYLSMVDRAIGYDIIGHFNAEITDALTNHTTFDTGIIRLARVMRNAALTARYYIYDIYVNGTAGTVTIRFDNSTTGTWTPNYNTVTYSESDYYALTPAQRYIFFVHKKGRSSMAYEGMPNYSNQEYILLVHNLVDKKVGTWMPPSTGYNYGHMVYTTSSKGILSDLPGGTIPCASDNEQSRMQQSELIAASDPYSDPKWNTYNTDGLITLTDYEGHNNPNPDPYNPPGPGDGPGPGGFGPQDDIVDPIPVPDVPPIGACDAGFVTMYHLTTAEMAVFAQDLYDPDAIQAILSMFRNPMDFICGVMLMPFAPVGTHMYYPKFGTYTWHNAYAKVEEEYKVVDCGTININHYYNTCFDYSPFYRIKLWLPYIGYREIDTDEVMGSTLNVVYHIDVLTGNCVAFVNKPNVGIYGPQIPKVIAQFDGNVGVKIPVTSTSYDQMIGACVNLIGRIATVGAAVAGGVGGYMATEVAAQQIGSQIMGSTTDAVNSNKVSAQRSGNCSGVSGFMAIQKPHVLIELPWQDLPTNYQALEGYPSNKGGTLSQFSGFAAVETIKLQISGALDAEKEEINSILKGGVYI